MKKPFLKVIVIVGLVLTLSLHAYAGQLDDYYLTTFGFQVTTPNVSTLQKSVLLPIAEPEDMPRCGTPLKHGLRRDWQLLEQTTQKVLAKQLSKPALSGSEQTFLSLSGRFKIHYTTTGVDAATPSWVQIVAQTLDDVAASYIALLWQPAPTTDNVPYDVYLRDLATVGFYGVTNSNQSAPTANHPNAFTSWLELDNNFSDSIYKPATYSPLQTLQITAVHEYHHAIQYGYNYYFDIWYAEATSTWMEDELHDGVNQLYNYIPSWFTKSTLSLDIADNISTGGGYGRWIFNRYLSEKYDSIMVRNAWENLAGIVSPNGYDIPMTPVLESVLSSIYGTSLGNDFFGFAKRVYTRDWTTHSADIAQIHPYSPVATYSKHPVNSTASSPTPSISLPHYSFAYYKFTPTVSVSSDLVIHVTGTSAIAATVFKKTDGIISEIQPDANGTLFTVTGFSSLNPAVDEVVLLMVNTTSLDNQIALFSTIKPEIPGDCDTNGTVSVVEVQSAINMFLGLKVIDACVDMNNNEHVSIAEVQKVINGFLGL